MRIETSRRLRGPNRYLSRPVLLATVQLDDLTDRENTDFLGFDQRLTGTLPGVAEHHCAAGRPGGFVERLVEGTYFGHIAEHVAIELSRLVGREVNFGRTTYAGGPGRYHVVIECPVDEPAGSPVPEALLALAIDVVTALVDDAVPHYDEQLAAIRHAYEAERPGPSTAAIAAAARQRGVPVERVGALSLLRLGHGRHRRLVWAAMTDQTSAVGVDIAADKQLTRQLLADAGVPVPGGGAARTLADALRLFAELGPPVVIKPRRGRQGAHVFLGVDSPEAVRSAFDAATADGGEAVVEHQLGGRDYRVLTVGERVVAAAERIAARVLGDGVTDVAGLIAGVNADPRRGTGHSRPLTRLVVDEIGQTLLCRQGLTLASVPAAGQVVWLRDNANLSTGGTSVDVTDRVHPDVAELCRRVAALVGLDVAGIDLRLPDISAPLPPAAVDLPPGSGAVIEVNAAPGLRMHLTPAGGGARDVGSAVLDALYPAGTPNRIPTVAITGTNGKTTVARLTAHLLAGAGLRVGLTSSDGVYIGGHLVQRADATGPRSAQAVLGDPTVDAAVLETARGGLLRYGLGYDWSDVGVITNISADHLGQDGVEDLTDLIGIKSIIAERVRRGGTLVLNADDPLSRGIAAGLAERFGDGIGARRIVWFSLNPRSPLVREHWDAGGRAYLLADGWLVEIAERRWVPLLAANQLAGAFGGAAWHMVANALAATAAARDLGVTTAGVAERLRTFEPAASNPGRGTLLRLGDVHVLVDYAHNPAAIAATGELLHRVWGGERSVACVTLPGDRRDDLLAESAREVADRFDRVVLYEDQDRRGRGPGEVPALVRGVIEARRPDAECTVVRTVAEAVPAALALARPGDVVLVLYEKIEPVLALLDGLGAEPGETVTPVTAGSAATAATPAPTVGALSAGTRADSLV
jgi:cyanophycin synthetase